MGRGKLPEALALPLGRHVVDAGDHIYDDSYSASWWAVGDNPLPACGGHADLDMKFNLATTAGMDAFDREAIAVHEFGHGLGLGHSGQGCGQLSIMGFWGDATSPRYVCGALFPPFADDKLGADAVY